MVYSPTMPTMKLSAQDLGVPDYQKALENVFNNVQNAYKTAYTPKTMAEQLLAKQLENKINAPKAEHAEELTMADLMNKRASTGHIGAQTDLLKQQLLAAKIKQDLTNYALQQAGLGNSKEQPTQRGYGSYGPTKVPENQQNYYQPQTQQPEVQRPVDMTGLTPANDLSIDKKLMLEKISGLPLLTQAERNQIESQKALQKELGKTGADQIKNLEDTYFNADTQLQNLKDVGDIVGSSEFEEIRHHPILGHREIGYYAKFGSPEQQEMIGNYLATTGEIIKAASRDFAGQFRKGEQGLLESMKPTASDTPEVARGKVAALNKMVSMLRDRSGRTSQLMRQGLTKVQANEIAEKEFNAPEFKKKLKESLHTQNKIKLKNSKTGESRWVTKEEARKLGVKNV